MFFKVTNPTDEAAPDYDKVVTVSHGDSDLQSPSADPQAV
jgi:hypothetical protein